MWTNLKNGFIRKKKKKKVKYFLNILALKDLAKYFKYIYKADNRDKKNDNKCS